LPIGDVADAPLEGAHGFFAAVALGLLAEVVGPNPLRTSGSIPRMPCRSMSPSTVAGRDRRDAGREARGQRTKDERRVGRRGVTLSSWEA
jgi:hypothetical protein